MTSARFPGIAEQQKVLDMAYLYADPIVKRGKDGNLKAVSMPLDLDAEYLNLVDNLRHTGKEFSIKKEAINFQSLSQIISKNPKIIHISAHGG